MHRLGLGRSQITETVPSGLQSSAQKPHRTEFPKLILSYIGGICLKGANFSTGKRFFFPLQPKDAGANTRP